MKLILVFVAIVVVISAMKIDQKMLDDDKALEALFMRAQKEKNEDLYRSLYAEYAEIYTYMKGELEYTFQGKRSDIPEEAFNFKEVAFLELPEKDKYTPCCQLHKREADCEKCLITDGPVIVHYENGDVIRGRVVGEVVYEEEQLKGRKVTYYL